MYRGKRREEGGGEVGGRERWGYMYIEGRRDREG